MNERHRRVLACIEAGPKRSREIARELGQSIDYTSDLCGQLREMGLARSERGGSDGRALFWLAVKGAEEPDESWANLPPQVVIRDARTAPPLRPQGPVSVFDLSGYGSLGVGNQRGAYRR